MATALSEYLAKSYQSDRDYIDGETRERNVGYYPHSFVLGWVGAQLMKPAHAIGCVSLISVRVFVRPNRVLVPDVCLAWRTARDKNVIETPPLLCVEIMDRRDTRTAIQHRVDDYLAMGTKCVWVIDPEQRFGEVIQAGGFVRRDSHQLLVDGTPIVLSLDQLFAELDE